MFLPVFIQKYFLGICFIVSALSLSAQTKEEPEPKKIADPKDHIVIDCSYDSYTHFPTGISQKPYSIGGNAYLMWDYPFGYGPFSIAIGAGISTHDVHTNGQITYSIDGKYTTFTPLTVKYNTNKFSANYIEIPLELRIRTRGQNKFKMSVGGKAGYAFNVHTKYADADGKMKVYKIKNIDPLRYGVTFRVGYNKFNIQAFYALSELFTKGHGEPKMTPFSIGVGLLFY
ncbi:MAG: outer membrane beta-barrel protein [Bacteroidia bacterium]